MQKTVNEQAAMANSQKPGTYEVGYKKPPRNRQFGQPEGNKRSRGSWKKEDTPRYKLEQMMKLDEDELRLIIGDHDAPMFERQLAKWLIKGDWKVIESQINQVYGAPKQQTETTLDVKPSAIEIKVLKPVKSAQSRKDDK